MDTDLVVSCDATQPENKHIVRLWHDPGPDEGGGWLIWPGQTTTVYVIQGTSKVMVLFTTQDTASATDVAAPQQILYSVEVHPAP